VLIYFRPIKIENRLQIEKTAQRIFGTERPMSNEQSDVKTHLSDPALKSFAGETETLPKNILTPGESKPDSALIGTILHNRYQIEKKLGDGGFGSVFLARDNRLVDKAVVVKVLERNDNEWVGKKFQQEREALSRIEHPGVVGIQDAGELVDGQPFIVMQFVKGVTLREAVQQNPLSVQRTADITEQIAHAVGSAHEQGILHRDLKPENIMLSPLVGGREQVKVIDFGIAKVRESRVAESSTGLFSAGTLFYMPPESLQGKPYSAASEVYVLAVLVYEMLTGVRPFAPSVESPLLFAGALLDMQQTGAEIPVRKLPNDLPETARNILIKALAFEPSARYDNIIQFGREFSQAANTNINSIAPRIENPVNPALAQTVQSGQFIQQPMSPTPSTPEIYEIPALPPTPKPKSKTMFVVAGLAILLIGAMALAGGFWYFNRTPNVETAQTATVPNVSNAPNVSVRYWLNVQKMRDGKEFQEPFKSSGQEVYENGYKFQLNADSSKKGFLYLFNEGTGEQKDRFGILFPTPKRNDGSAQVAANEALNTGWNVFSGDTGTEKCWLIWTEEENSMLEDVRKNAFENKGAVQNASLENLKKFISENTATQATVKKDSQNRQVVVEEADKVLVNLIELEHR
jgi:serine/threonine protein kinase